MISQKRPTLLLAAVTLATIGWSIPGEAQIIYPFPPPYRYTMNVDSSVRLDVTPKQAEVYVDGYYAGIADDFSGAFKRLHVEPGQHEFIIYRDGFRTVRRAIYLMPNKTFKINLQMEPLAPGDVSEARPVPVTPPQPPVAQGPQGPFPTPRGGRRFPRPNQPPPSEPAASAPPPAAAGTGTLAVQLQPADADVVIDGQPWPAAQRQDRFVIDLSEGRHVIQVRKAGYVGYLTEVEVRRGETTTLDINLRTQP